jgi:hypothetical protein
MIEINKLYNMKTKFLFLMLFSAILFIGCSTDTQEDFLYDSSSSELSVNSLKAKVVTRPFKFKASGDWFIIESTECNGLIPYTIKGNGNATHMGLMDVDGRICSYPPDLHFLTVKFTAANGDELNWESVEVFFNEDGLYAGGVFNCLGGTGRFENATGSITVNEFITITDFDPETGLPLSGIFSNSGNGTVIY